MSREARKMAHEFRKTAEEVDMHAWNVNITRVVGSGVSFLGSGFAVVTFCTATEWLFPLAVAGATITMLGGMTSAGASVYRTCFTKSTMDRCRRMWEDRQGQGQLKIPPPPPQSVGVWKIFPYVLRTACDSGSMHEACTGFTVGSNPFYTTYATQTMTSKNALLLSSAVSGVVSLLDFVSASLELNTETGCEAGDLLRWWADSLENMN